MRSLGDVLKFHDRAGFTLPREGYDLADKAFTTVAKADVDSLWSAWWGDLPGPLRRHNPQTQMRETAYLEDTWDCENQSEDFVSFVCRAAAVTRIATKAPRAGTLCGTWTYRAAGSGGGYLGWHRAVIYVDKLDKVRFLQPQTGREFSPTGDEIKSCVKIRYR